MGPLKGLMGAKMTPNRSVPRYGSIGGGLESFIEHKPVILVAPNAETSVAVQWNEESTGVTSWKR